MYILGGIQLSFILDMCFEIHGANFVLLIHLNESTLCKTWLNITHTVHMVGALSSASVVLERSTVGMQTGYPTPFPCQLRNAERVSMWMK